MSELKEIGIDALRYVAETYPKFRESALAAICDYERRIAAGERVGLFVHPTEGTFYVGTERTAH